MSSHIHGDSHARGPGLLWSKAPVLPAPWACAGPEGYPGLPAPQQAWALHTLPPGP